MTDVSARPLVHRATEKCLFLSAGAAAAISPLTHVPICWARHLYVMKKSKLESFEKKHFEQKGIVTDLLLETFYLIKTHEVCSIMCSR